MRRRKQVEVSAEAEKLIGNFGDAAQSYGLRALIAAPGDEDVLVLDLRLMRRYERRLREYIAGLELDRQSFNQMRRGDGYC